MKRNEWEGRKRFSGRLQKHFCRQAIAVIQDIYPGMPAFQQFASSLMPLEVYLGNGGATDEPVIWRPGCEKNGMLTVLGCSGSGKTEALKVIGSQIIQQGIPLVTIDFHGDLEFEGQNSVILSGGRSNQVSINPLAFNPSFIDDMGLLGKVEREVERIDLAVGRLGPKQHICLRDAMMQVYSANGITDETASLGGHWMPTLPQVSQLLRRCAAGESDALAIYPSSTISSCYVRVSRLANCAVFDGGNWVAPTMMTQYSLRFQCKSLSQSTQALVAETILQMLFEEEKAKGPIPVHCKDDSERFRLFVMVDEAKILTQSKQDVNRSDHIVNVIATEGRKYGIGLIVASQMSDHYGYELKANASASLTMLCMGEREAKLNAQTLGISSSLLKEKAPVGSAYFSSAVSRQPIAVCLDQLPCRSPQKRIAE